MSLGMLLLHLLNNCKLPTVTLAIRYECSPLTCRLLAPCAGEVYTSLSFFLLAVFAFHRSLADCGFPASGVLQSSARVRELKNPPDKIRVSQQALWCFSSKFAVSRNESSLLEMY